jgi:hypothetical protein
MLHFSQNESLQNNFFAPTDSLIIKFDVPHHTHFSQLKLNLCKVMNKSHFFFFLLILYLTIKQYLQDQKIDFELTTWWNVLIESKKKKLV